MSRDNNPTTPLLTPEDEVLDDPHDVESQHEDDPVASNGEELLRVGAMLGMVVIGLVVILLIFFWPLVFGFLLPSPETSIRMTIGYLLGLQLVHVLLLVYLPFPYLYLHRKAFYPIRMILMPLVNKVTKSESIREKEVVWYNTCSGLPHTRDPLVLLRRLKPSCRKDLRKKLKLFFEHGITTQTVHSDFLSLRHDIPILWAHEKRAVQNSDKSVVGEFIKRFLVLCLLSHAYLDRYYDKDGKVCALGLFVGCKNTINNFLYFCLEDQSRSGIWQYHHFRGLLRAVAASPPDIEFINFQIHQGYAKRLAGAIGADYRDDELMSKLFPFALFKEPPADVIDLTITREDIIPS